MAAVNIKLFIEKGGMAENSTPSLASRPGPEGTQGMREAEKNHCVWQDQQTKLNFPMLKTFFREAKDSCYCLHKINASTATLEGERVSVSAKTQQSLGKAVWSHLGTYWTISIDAKGKLGRWLRLVSHWHPICCLLRIKVLPVYIHLPVNRTLVAAEQQKSSSPEGCRSVPCWGLGNQTSRGCTVTSPHEKVNEGFATSGKYSLDPEI